MTQPLTSFHKDNFVEASAELLELTRENEYAGSVLQTILPAIEKNLLQKKAPLTAKEKMIRKVQYLLYHYSFDLTPASGEKYQVLIWPVQLIHVEFLIPVYRSLKQRGVSVAFICVRKDVAKLINDHGGELIMIEEKISKKPSKQGFRRLRDIRFILDKATGLESRYKGIRETVELSLNNFYFWDSYKAIFGKAQEIFKPEYHLLGYDFSSVCRAVNIRSNAEGLPSGSIQHGSINYLLSPFSICSEQFVWDELTSDFLKRVGYKGDIHLVGSPNDTHFSPIRETGDNPVATYFQKKYAACMLVCFSGPGHNVSEAGHVENIKALHQVIDRFPEVSFVIKLHPKDKMSYFNAFLDYSNVLMVDQAHVLYKQPITAFLGYCDVMLTGASTVAIEAILFKKPVVSIDVPGELKHIDLLNSPMIYKCHSEVDLGNALASVLDKNEMYKEKTTLIAGYSDRYFQKREADPSQTIAELIKKRISSPVLQEMNSSL